MYKNNKVPHTGNTKPKAWPLKAAANHDSAPAPGNNEKKRHTDDTNFFLLFFFRVIRVFRGSIFLIVLALPLWILLAAPTILAGAEVVFYTQKFTRDTGKPENVTAKINIEPAYTGEGFRLAVTNGDQQGEHRVSSVEIKIGDIYIGPENFNQRKGTVERDLSLETANTLSVELRGKPGGFISITITKDVPHPEIIF